ncbi:putative nuclease HARBI1 [Heterodontus francisci]|uniref:putative nuclease HARBI1 n=1 Tax=Heterodontus francisci TaxID=7792 RepID=UPI00355BBA35
MGLIHTVFVDNMQRSSSSDGGSTRSPPMKLQLESGSRQPCQEGPTCTRDCAIFTSATSKCPRGSVSKDRLSKEAITNLCAMLQDKSQPMEFCGHPMPVALKVTVALNFYAFGSFQGSTGGMCGVSQVAAHLCIKEMTNALLKRAGDYVCHRTNPDSQAKWTISFGAIVEFSQVQLVIDLTHVAIKAPMEQPAAFNRKDFHSINVQLVCYHQKHFLQCVPASWEAVTIPTYFDRMDSRGQGLPIEDRATDTGEKPSHSSRGEVQYMHGSTRVTIEQAIGLLTLRFPCLDRSGGALQYAPVRVSRIMVVCCALHNLALQRGEALHEEDMFDHQASTDEENVEEVNEQAALDIAPLALEARHIEKWPGRQETIS